MVRAKDESLGVGGGSSYDYFTIFGKALSIFSRKYLNNSLVSELIALIAAEDSRSLKTLAQDLIPDEFLINPVVATKIIHIAMQRAISDYSAESNIDKETISQTRNSRVKSAANHKRNSGKVMLEASGKQPFSDQELSLVLILISGDNQAYFWQNTHNQGSPNWAVIALKLNSVFKNKRTGKSLADQIKTMRYAKDERLERLRGQFITPVVAESQYYMNSFIADLIIEKGLYQRNAQTILEIVTNVEDLRSYWEIVRDVFPDEFEYGEQAANQLISTFVEMLQGDPYICFDNESFGYRKAMIRGNRSRINRTADTMLERQGVIRFTRAEFQRFMELRREQEYIHQNGGQKGRTDYDRVAATLNSEFHVDESIRTKDKLSALIRAYRQNTKLRNYPNIDDWNIPVEQIVCAYYLSETEA